MECPVLKGGNSFDDLSVTATPEKARKGKTFLGRGSDDSQSGEMEEIPEKTYNMLLNGKVVIPPGIQSGSSKVVQDTLVIDSGGTIYPTGVSQTLRTKDRFMSGDYYLAALYGLTPENVKKDVIILGVKGAYEGYD